MKIKNILTSFFLVITFLLTATFSSFALSQVSGTGEENLSTISSPRIGCFMFVTNLKFRDGVKNLDLTIIKFGPESKIYKVIELQNALIGAGYLSGNATGYFGVKTLKAVKQYQKVNGITPTGFVGEKTQGVLRSQFCNLVQVQEKIKDCPSEKIINMMPVMCIRAPCPAIDNSYYIYNGVRKEITDFDANYVKNNCSVKETVVM